MKPLLVTSGEPAGIGPDICLSLAKMPWPVVILGDKNLLTERAQQLNLRVKLIDYSMDTTIQMEEGSLHVLSVPCEAPVVPGKLDIRNSPYVINLLKTAIKHLLNKQFSALVTAPIHKEIINQTGMKFTGHTEFLAHSCGVKRVVMMLACAEMRVALVTTHLPLKAVPEAITELAIIETIQEVYHSLKKDFGIPNPSILVAGLNPHAGEGGYLGREELESIIPALNILQKQFINVSGPYPADTLFTKNYLKQADVFVAMYHDQGLPVLKYVGFGDAVNITLGLPFIRTSVDHGTALTLAASGKAENTSLFKAIEMALFMVEKRAAYVDN